MQSPLKQKMNDVDIIVLRNGNPEIMRGAPNINGKTKHFTHSFRNQGLNCFEGIDVREGI